MTSEKFDIFPRLAAAELIEKTEAAKRRIFAVYGLSEGAALCLCRIYETKGGISAKELILSDKWGKSAISRHLKLLRERGFLNATDDGHYKQKMTLSPIGAAAARAISDEIDTLRRTVRQGVSDDDLDTFLGTLYRMSENINEKSRS